jgi:hypothetical protein
MAQSPNSKTNIPLGCDQCPLNANNYEGKNGRTIRQDPARVGFALFVGLFLVVQCYSVKIDRPNQRPDSKEVVDLGGWTVETREPNYLIFGIGFASAAAALGISIDPLLKLIPGRRDD